MSLQLAEQQRPRSLSIAAPSLAVLLGLFVVSATPAQAQQPGGHCSRSGGGSGAMQSPGGGPMMGGGMRGGMPGRGGMMSGQGNNIGNNMGNASQMLGLMQMAQQQQAQQQQSQQQARMQFAQAQQAQAAQQKQQQQQVLDRQKAVRELKSQAKSRPTTPRQNTKAVAASGETTLAQTNSKKPEKK